MTLDDLQALIIRAREAGASPNEQVLLLVNGTYTNLHDGWLGAKHVILAAEEDVK